MTGDSYTGWTPVNDASLDSVTQARLQVQQAQVAVHLTIIA